MCIVYYVLCTILCMINNKIQYIVDFYNMLIKNINVGIW